MYTVHSFVTFVTRFNFSPGEISNNTRYRAACEEGFFHKFDLTRDLSVSHVSIDDVIRRYSFSNVATRAEDSMYHYRSERFISIWQIARRYKTGTVPSLIPRGYNP